MREGEEELARDREVPDPAMEAAVSEDQPPSMAPSSLEGKEVWALEAAVSCVPLPRLPRAQRCVHHLSTPIIKPPDCGRQVIMPWRCGTSSSALYWGFNLIVLGSLLKGEKLFPC